MFLGICPQSNHRVYVRVGWYNQFRIQRKDLMCFNVEMLEWSYWHFSRFDSAEAAASYFNQFLKCSVNKASIWLKEGF